MNSMHYARRRHVDSLYHPHSYRPGKVTAHGWGTEERTTVLDIQGRGVLKRIWTTHKKADRLKVHIYVDDREEPVLSGLAHELAAAAGEVRCEAIPLGGFYDHKSTNLYLPIPFESALRIDADPLEFTGDGPYWQIDYALECEEDYPLPRQTDDNGQPVIAYEELPRLEPERGETTRVEEDVYLKSASPHNIWLEGGGIIRKIAITGRDLDSLLLRIAFDGERGEEDRLDPPFQVDAPMRYLVGPFDNACVERRGSTAILHFPMPFRSRAGLQLLAGMNYGSFREESHFNVRIEYEPTPPPPDEFRYFHARFRSEVTNGRDDFECCSTRGSGHFVGVHIFDTGHDHGGGDNVMFDAGAETAGQLHGICGEDYFHMAYMRIWNRTPYSGCPGHSARYRHHLEMPIPFEESFVFNWGSFASQPAKAVAFWYQDQPASPPANPELTYTLNGPFELENIDDLEPGAPFPTTVHPWPGRAEATGRSWSKKAQQGFVDLCHMHRRYFCPVPPSSGFVPSGTCTCAETRVWTDRPGPATLKLGCDDPIRLYLNGELVFRDDGRTEPDPFEVFEIPADLCEGVNTLRVVVGNTENYNWNWNGFSLVVETEDDAEIACLT